MPRLKLTDLTIKAIKPPEKFTTYWDEQLPGFGVRCSPKGKKTFTVMYGSERKRITVGQYPHVTLSEARTRAKSHLYNKHALKLNFGLSEARYTFIEECEKRLRPSTVKQYRQHLKSICKEKIGDVKRNDIDVSNPYAVASWKAFFNWLIQQQLTDHNPFQFLKAVTNKRERVLTNDEIKAIWAYDYPPYSNIVKLLFLTGLRRNEVMNLRLDGDMFKLAPEHTKNGKGHSIPATELGKRYYDKFDFNGWSKAKKRMDRETGVTDYCIHDIRRTYATIHAKIGTPIHLIEAILNHQSGVLSGIKAVYIKHNYAEEAKKAVANYEIHLREIVDM